MNLMKQLEYAEKVIKTSAIWEDLISEEDAAKKLGCTLSVLQSMKRKGLIRTYKLNGRNPMLSKTELINLLQQAT